MDTIVYKRIFFGTGRVNPLTQNWKLAVCMWISNEMTLCVENNRVQDRSFLNQVSHNDTRTRMWSMKILINLRLDQV